MSDVLDQVRDYVLELGLAIESEIPEEEILIVNDEERAISHLVIDCEDTILVLEQLIVQLPSTVDSSVYKRLLQINRTLIFGAFVLNEAGNTLVYRNTLALENLDLNELEGTLNALTLALAENGEELLTFVGEN
ncbi:MAG: YbjN domain-containing protein [Candidatus Latescibacterota bacterium]